MSTQTYVGQELDLFAHAHRWKRYWHGQIAPYLQGSVLEVGAGLGTNTLFMRSPAQSRWVALEPDRQLLTRLEAQVREAGIPPVEPVAGFLGDLPPDDRFDAILYIDVLEHIANDAEEFERAAARLRPGGRVIVLSPAHQWLYTPFDQALGHFRRYTRTTLMKAGCNGKVIPVERMIYLDSVGMLASLGNRLLLQKAHPTLPQILTWDRLMVPCSRVLDALLLRSVGKSILGIWRKPLS